MSPRHVTLALLGGALALGACGDDEADHDHDHDEPDAAVIEPDAAPQAVTIAFAAEVNGAAFDCGATYPGVGSTAASYVGIDFRFYVHDVALIPAGGGDPVPVTLDASDFQAATGLALLDFEDNDGACQTGSSGTNAVVTGTVPPGDYDGVTFKLGVPFEQNHLDPAGATGPLTSPGMSWQWQFGYKFVKIDGEVTPAGGGTESSFLLHVGSTGCPGDNLEQPPTGPCVNPNLATIELAAFDPAADTIVADIGAVLATSDVTVNTVDTAPGCMSFPGDPECLELFPRLGLPFDAAPAGAQLLFTVR